MSVSKKINDQTKTQSNKKIMIIAIVLTVIMIVGGTYAFWLWRGNITNMTISVEIPNIGLNLDGGITTVSGLSPASCTNTRYAVNSPITIKRYNETNFPAYVVLKLSLDSFTWTSGTTAPTSTALSNIRFAVSSNSATNINSTCSNAGILANTTSSVTNPTEILTYSPAVTITTGEYIGSLSGINAGTKNTPVTGQAKKILTWIYEMPANSGTEENPITETYYIYYWLDKNYTGVALDPTLYGSGASGIVDPLQNMTFDVRWSAENIVQVQDLTTVTSYTGA